MEVTILCDVIDNFGDIGVVYRLARSLSEISQEIKINIVVNNLDSFAKMAPGINPSLSIQAFMGWTVLDWNNKEECTSYFQKNHPRIILQCFQCIRPEWLENLLFSTERNETKEIIHIVNVEYLTAEEWADGFHLLKSATRSMYVKKRNFMPGFTSKTGGLILDKSFMECLRDKSTAINKLKPFLDSKGIDYIQDPSIKCIALFTYERDYSQIAKALSQCKKEICIFAADGLSYEPFAKALRDENLNIKVIKLPYLPQQEWDALLCSMDFAIIRGEDSFARICLCGIPFLWHAYRQDEEYQLIKVDALLKRMEPFFSEKDFLTVKRCMIDFNRTDNTIPGKEAEDLLDNLISKGISLENIPYSDYLCNMEKLESSFKSFSEMLIKNGNLSEKLLEYMKQLQF